MDHSLDLVVSVLPLAAGLSPVFGHAIGTILTDAGLMGSPHRVERAPA